MPNAQTSRGTNALWWNGSDSGLSISQISSPAATISFTVGGSSSGCGELYNGSLNSGAQAIQPNNSYFQYSGGTINLTLTGPIGANFDLELQRWNGSSWGRVAQSNSGTANESISYSANSGYYRVIVRAVSGSGAYQLNISK